MTSCFDVKYWIFVVLIQIGFLVSSLTTSSMRPWWGARSSIRVRPCGSIQTRYAVLLLRGGTQPTERS